MRYKKYLSSYAPIPRSTIRMRKWRQQQREKLQAEQDQIPRISTNVQGNARDKCPAALTTSFILEEISPASLEANALNAEKKVKSIRKGTTSIEEVVQILNPGGTETENVPNEAYGYGVLEEDLNPLAAHTTVQDKATVHRLPSACSHTTFTPDDVLVMVRALGVRHGLTSVALEDILKMINTIFGSNAINTSKFSFLKWLGIS